MVKLLEADPFINVEMDQFSVRFLTEALDWRFGLEIPQLP